MTRVINCTALLALILTAPSAFGQDKKPAVDTIRFPVVTIVVPIPAPPVGVPKLTGADLYVVEADVACIVTAEPRELVKITKFGPYQAILVNSRWHVANAPTGTPDFATQAEANAWINANHPGPLRILGRFVGGTGKTELRTFNGKSVWVIEAAGVGRTTVLAISSTATEETDILRKVVDVDNGQAPRPPPDPPLPPIPDEPTDDFYKSLKAAWLTETDKSKRPELAALYRQSAKIAKNDLTLTTAKELFDKIHIARISLIGESLPNVRKAITARLDANLPRSITAPLDAATRDKAASEFDLIAKHLERLP